MDLLKACCFTGPRPEKLPWRRNERDVLCKRTREALAVAIEAAYRDGYRLFYCGMAQGVDLMAAELVLQIRDNFHDDIRLALAIPCATQSVRWLKAQKARYRFVMEQCRPEDIHVLQPSYTGGCMERRNRYMVERSERIIGVYDGRSGGGTAYTLLYAAKNGLETVCIDPNAPQYEPPEREQE